MSLINEALKRAQTDRPGGPPAPDAGGPPPTPDQPQQKKNRGFFWGFILAVLIVGTVSSILAAYLVLQLIEPSKPAAEPAEEVALTPALAVEEPSLPGPVAVPETQLPTAREPVPLQEAIEEPEIPLAVPKEQALQPASEEPESPVDETSPPETRKPDPEPVTDPSPPLRPDPEVVNRLLELEIRGIMSGGTKVLIQDSVSGRTRAYQEGDSIEGLYGLVVENIDKSSIQFRDYAGFLHTKSF